MDALLDYLDDIEEVLDSGKSLPFTNKISVEKERITDIIGEIRMNLPDDIRSAQRILGDHDRIVAEAERKAQGIIEAAENEAKIRTSNHEIFRRASDQASETVEKSKENAKELRMNAKEYADDKLKDCEDMIQDYMTNLEEQHKQVMEYLGGIKDVIYENRQQLRGV